MTYQEQEHGSVLSQLWSRVKKLVDDVLPPYGSDRYYGFSGMRDGVGDERDSLNPTVATRAWERFGGTPPEHGTDPAPLTEEPPPSL